MRLRLTGAVEGFLARAVGTFALVLVTIVAFELGAGAVWWLVTLVRARSGAAALERRWADMGRPFGHLSDRYPIQDANSSARHLEELAAPLGIQLAPRGATDRVVPGEPAVAASQQIKESVGDYVAFLARADRRVTEPPPAAVQAFLQRHDAALDQVTAHLLGAEEPRWRQDISPALNIRLPNLLGQIHLAKLLVARSALHLSQQRTADASRDLEAAWRLQRAAADRPEQISQLIGLTEAQHIAGAARNHPDPPTHWPAMLLEHDYRDSILGAYEFDAWAALETARGGELLGGEGLGGKLVRTVSTPYVICQLTLSGEAIRSAVQTLPHAPFADFDPGEGFAAAIETNMPQGIAARVAHPDLWSIWARVGRGMLCLELSAEVVELHSRARAEGSAAWASLSPERTSRLFPSISWSFTPTARGLRIAPRQRLPAVPEVARRSLCESYLVEAPRGR